MGVEQTSSPEQPLKILRARLSRHPIHPKHIIPYIRRRKSYCYRMWSILGLQLFRPRMHDLGCCVPPLARTKLHWLYQVLLRCNCLARHCKRDMLLTVKKNFQLWLGAATTLTRNSNSNLTPHPLSLFLTVTRRLLGSHSPRAVVP